MHFERGLVEQALEAAGGNQAKAAGALGMNDLACALQLQETLFLKWENWDTALAAIEEVSEPEFAGIRGKLFEDWRELVADESVGTCYRDPDEPQPTWVHSLVDAVAAGDAGPALFRDALRRWLEEIGKSPTTLKDNLSNDLDRSEPGPRYTHFPVWLGGFFFAELTAEVRTPKRWENPSGRRNEAFDLMVYARALLKLISADKINWNNPPSWARITVNNTIVNDGFQSAPKARRVRNRGVRL